MKPSDFQKTVMCRFDSCLKKTVFGVVKDYYKELKKNQAEAIPFCELPDIIIDKVAIWDTEYYGSNVPLFRRNGYRQSGVMIP